MSSPCLLRAAPMSQPRLREVKISLKASGREAPAIHRSAGGATRPYALPEKEAPVRVSAASSRSRSTPPVHRAQRPEIKKTEKGSGGRQPEPELHPERNGSLHVPLAALPAGHVSASRRQRPSHPQPPPAPTLSSSSSSSSSARSMKRARWLSYSTSNICFNSILEGRFRQLQGTGVMTPELCVCASV